MPAARTPRSSPSWPSEIRLRKVEAIRRAAGTVDPLVVSANPGCAMHLAAVGLDVRHPAELLADALADASADTSDG